MGSPSKMRVNVLGPLQVEVAGTPLALNGRLKHRLLARLALYPGQAVDSDGLIEALWGDNAPRTAKQSLHVHISSVRDRLRSVAAERLITTTAEGRYVMAGDVVVDALVFEALANEGTVAYRNGNLRSAVDKLGDAVAMWAEPYESLSNHYGAMAQRQRLLSIHEQAVDEYIETLAALGQPDVAIPILRSTIATEPLRERPYVQLMGIYLGQRESVLARAVFDDASALFRAQLGASPSRELFALRDTIESGAGRDTSTAEPGGDATSGVPFNLDNHTLVEVATGADTASLQSAIRSRAVADGRQVAHGRVIRGAASGLSPLLELAGFHNEPGSSRSQRLRSQLFDRITRRLITRFFVAPIVVIEGIEHASELLCDYLTHALCRPGPDAFTLIGVHSAGDQVDTLLTGEMSELFRYRTSVSLPPSDVLDVSAMSFDDAEREILELLTCASLPAPTELIARSSERSAVDVADAIERLAVRRLVTHEPDGHLGLRDPAETTAVLALSDDRRARTHLAMATAFEAWVGIDDAARVVSQARHLLQAGRTAAWGTTSEITGRAFLFLESLGAYDDIVSLASTSAFPVGEWPKDTRTLALLVGLGRAQIRSARTVDGTQTLEQAILLARDLGEPVLFAEAVRGWLEERAPQRFDQAARSLISEALESLGDDVSETRVQLLTDMANSSYFIDLEEAKSWSEQALDVAQNASPATRGRALTGHVQALLRPDNAPDRLAWSLEAQRFARSGDSIETLVLALTYEACSLMELGEPKRADPPLQYAAALAAEVQVPRFRWWAAAWQALLGFAVGDLAAAEEQFMAAFELWPASSRADAFQCLACQIATLRFVEGRGAELLSAFDDLSQPDDAGIEYLAPAALAHAQAGNEVTAAGLLARLTDSPSLVARGNITVPYALALGAEAAYLIEDQVSAVVLAREIAPIAHVHATLNVWGGGGFYWGSLHHGLGLMHAVLGERGAAEQSLVRALSENLEAGVKTFADRTRAALTNL